MGRDRDQRGHSPDKGAKPHDPFGGSVDGSRPRRRRKQGHLFHPWSPRTASTVAITSSQTARLIQGCAIDNEVLIGSETGNLPNLEPSPPLEFEIGMRQGN